MIRPNFDAARVRTRAIPALVLTALVLGAGVSCAPHAADLGPPSTEGAFGPESLRIYPLTRLDKAADGKPIVVCHIELKDRWGDTTKGVGRLEIRLLRPAAPAGGTEASDQTWELDLSNWELNASLYDKATRTYRIQLGEIPAWLAEQAPGGKLGAASDGTPVCRLSASYIPRGGADAPERLRDEFVVRR
jgi:hypothetical protein